LAAVTETRGEWRDVNIPPLPYDQPALVPGTAADERGKRAESSAKQGETNLHGSHPFLRHETDSPGPESFADVI
jgi:hypothetical protein